MPSHDATKKAISSAIRTRIKDLMPYLDQAKELGLTVVIATADVERPNGPSQPLYLSITDQTGH